jgi:integrase/recombinase XerD
VQWIEMSKHAARTRAMFMCSLLAGMRACEIAALQVNDVLSSESEVRMQVYLSQLHTKGNYSR